MTWQEEAQERIRKEAARLYWQREILYTVIGLVAAAVIAAMVIWGRHA